MNSLPRRFGLVFILVTIFLDVLGYSMVVPLLPFFVTRQAGGALLAGAFSSIYALMQLLSGPVLGALSDRYGRRPVLLACLLGTALAFCLLGLAQSLEAVFLAVLLDGMSGGNLTTANAYVADVSTPEDRGRAIGLAGAALGLGLMAGPVLGGLLSGGGLSLAAFCAAGVALVNVLYGLLALPESLPPERRSRRINRGMFNPLAQLRGLLQAGDLRPLLAALFTLNLAFAGLQTNFPLFSQARFGWDASRNGFFYAFVGVCAVSVQGGLLRWAQPRFGERRLALAGLGLMAAGLAGTALAERDGLLYLWVGLAAVGSGLSIPSLTALASNRVGEASQGRLMGGAQALLSLTMILGPGMAGLAFEGVGIQAPYFLGSLLACAAWGMAYRGIEIEN